MIHMLTNTGSEIESSLDHHLPVCLNEEFLKYHLSASFFFFQNASAISWYRHLAQLMYNIKIGQEKV